MDELNKKYEYIKFSMQAKTVERAVFATESLTRKENVAEHTFMMSLIFWTIKDELLAEFPQLSVVKVYDMIQIHDLIEIYTQDISTWDHLDADKNKVENEKAAAERIAAALSSSKSAEYLSLFNEIEDCQTIEAKIVKGIDRLSPAIQRFVTKQGWVSESHRKVDLDAIQLPRISFSTTLTAIYALLKIEAIALGILQ